MNLGSYDSLMKEATTGSDGCGFTLLRTTHQVDAKGGRGSFTAEASSQTAECRWGAQASEPWINLADSAGVGTGTLNFSVEANRTTTARTGTIDLKWPDGSATLTVKQDGLTNCGYALTPSSQSVAAASKDFSVTVTPSDPSCSWRAESDVPWIAITSGASNTGVGTVVYGVQTNGTHATRNGSIAVTGFTAGRSRLIVTQSAE